MTTMAAPKPPELASSRHQARTLLDGLPSDASGYVVMIDCAAVLSSAPSFVDELVRICLVERDAARLELRGASERTAQLAERAAVKRGVRDRLVVEPPSPRRP